MNKITRPKTSAYRRVNKRKRLQCAMLAVTAVFSSDATQVSTGLSLPLRFMARELRCRETIMSISSVRVLNSSQLAYLALLADVPVLGTVTQLDIISCVSGLWERFEHALAALPLKAPLICTSLRCNALPGHCPLDFMMRIALSSCGWLSVEQAYVGLWDETAIDRPHIVIFVIATTLSPAVLP